MENIVKNKKQDAIASSVLYVFFVLRALCIFGSSKTGIDCTREGIYMFSTKSVIFLLLTAVLYILFTLIIRRIYLSMGTSALPLIMLIAGEPKFPAVCSNNIEAFICILLLAAVLIIISTDGIAGGIAVIAVSAAAGILMPTAVFGYLPLLLIIHFFIQPPKTRKPVFEILGLIVFAAASVVHYLLFKSYTTDFNIFMYEYSDNVEFSHPDIRSHFFNNIPGISVTIISAVIFVLLLSKAFKYASSFNKNERIEIKNSLSVTAVFVGSAILVSLIGEIIYGKPSVSLMLIWVILLISARQNSKPAVKLIDKANSLFKRNPVIYIIMLALFSFICISLYSNSELYSHIGSDFIVH